LNKKFVSLIIFLGLSAPARASFTPGHYQIQDLGGNPIGVLAVSVEKSTYDEKPATRVEWKFIYDKAPFKSTEHHEAFITKDGLAYFRKEVVDDDGKAFTEGRVAGDSLIVRIDDHGRKTTVGALRKQFQVSEYDLDGAASPLAGMELKAAKSIGVFSVRELGAVTARRNVNGVEQLKVGDRYVATLVMNTSFSKSVVTSWFIPKTHVLLKERWSDRQFVRTGD
jgi:hypothetical protein